MPSTRGPVGRTVLPEIQALRAIAVVGVIVYHLWPGVVRGGFVGVDVFFVISGYLITAHLLRENAGGRISLSRFYARRIRRLLPAALLVLAVSTIGTLTLLSVGVWPHVLREVVAATFYVENWVLAADSLDYFALNSGPSPVQHYWSLSVEEQFYLAWPLLLMLGAFISSRATRASQRWILPALLAAVLVVSLGFSIAFAITEPQTAYFGTHNRAWEFAAGGLLAVFSARAARSPALNSALSWAGLVMVAAALLLYNGSIPFPGIAAALPVVGTLLIIVAGDRHSRFGPSRLLAFRPVQVLGDLSYGIYLWHWPLLVFVPVLLYGTPNIVVKCLVLVATILLAAFTKRFVEDPLRSGPLLGRRRTRVVFVSAAAAMALVATFAAIPMTTAPSIIERQQRDNTRAAIAAGDCLGAGVIADPGCASPSPGEFLVPGIDAALTDDVNTLDCWSRIRERELETCTYGPTSGAPLRVALVGDSHSNHYLSAMIRIASDYGWQVDIYGKAGCIWSSAQRDENPGWLADCEAWKVQLNDLLTSGEPYDVIVTSAATQSAVRAADGKSTEQTTVDGFVDVWRPVTARGSQVVAIRDSPQTTPGYLECISHHRDDPGPACSRPQSEAFDGFDGQPEAVRLVDGAHLVDFTRYFCPDGTCPPVIGNVIVYRDIHHLTSTYARTLAPMLHDEILALTGLTD